MAGGATSDVVGSVDPGPAAVVVVAAPVVEPGVVVVVVVFDVVVVALACCVVGDVVSGELVPGIGADEVVVPGTEVVEIGTWVEMVTTPRPKTENR